MSSVAYQTVSGGTGTTRATLSLTYTSSNPTTISLGGTIQTNTYPSGYLTNIADGGGKTIINATYVTTTPGKVANVTTANGSLGYDYASASPQCSGQTALFFNLASTTACSVDADCGTGYRCGGKTGTGTTGKCYRAARCLATTSPSENLITTVTPFTPCTGACAPVAQYSWDTTTLDLKGIKLANPTGPQKWTSFRRDSNGLVTTLAEGDTDDDATTGGVQTWFYYDDPAFPGRVTEVRKPSDLKSPITCTPASTTNCKRTLFDWQSDGQGLDGLLQTKVESGYTGYQGNTPFSHTTAYTYNTKGQVVQIDGPFSLTRTEFTYWTSTDVLKDGYVNVLKHWTSGTQYLSTTLDGYDYFGNTGSSQNPDGTFTCRTWDGNRNYLSQMREAMAAQGSCTGSNGSDLLTSYLRDTSLRLTKTTNPVGDCAHREYDGYGRLLAIKPRDDCNAASSGHTKTIAYTPDGQAETTEWLDATQAATRRKKTLYLDGKQLAGFENPVQPSYSRTFSYFDDGAFQKVTFENGIGMTEWERDSQNRETKEKRFTSISTSLDWLFTYPVNNATSTRTKEKVTDPLSLEKVTSTFIDDLGRRAWMDSFDSGTTTYSYDAASRLLSKVDAYATVDQLTHSFTYDNLGRVLTESNGTDCGLGAVVDVQKNYDALPIGVSCPVGAACTRLPGRLARTKEFLFCASDVAKFQETFYGYDDAGRLISEYIKDDTGRTASQTYSWNKNGNLTDVKAPSGASMTNTYGALDNSDANRLTTIARSVSGSPTTLISGIHWAPFGPVTQYNQQNIISGNPLKASVILNMAYRATSVSYQANPVIATTVTSSEDAKGRHISKVYSNVDPGIASDYFTYDWLDRVTCELETPASECTGRTTVYNPSNDRSEFYHSGPGFGSHRYTINYVSSVSDKINTITSPTVATYQYSWNARGDRTYEHQPFVATPRYYYYDGRRRLSLINGYYWPSPGVQNNYNTTYSYDTMNRLIFRSFTDYQTLVQSQTFYYYDLNDRLIEVKIVPNIATPSTYTVYDFYWLGRRPVALWATAFPSATTARYFMHGDESGRVLEMYSWPTSGDASRVWALNPDASGWDNVVAGSSLYQPLRRDNRLEDPGTVAYTSSAALSRPALLIGGSAHAYDPMSGTSLQVSGEYPSEPYTARVAEQSPGGTVDFCNRNFGNGISGSWTWGGDTTIEFNSSGIDGNQFDCMMDFHLVNGSISPPDDWFPTATDPPGCKVCVEEGWAHCTESAGNCSRPSYITEEDCSLFQSNRANCNKCVTYNYDWVDLWQCRKGNKPPYTGTRWDKSCAARALAKFIAAAGQCGRPPSCKSTLCATSTPEIGDSLSIK